MGIVYTRTSQSPCTAHVRPWLLSLKPTAKIFRSLVRCWGIATPNTHAPTQASLRRKWTHYERSIQRALAERHAHETLACAGVGVGVGAHELTDLCRTMKKRELTRGVSGFDYTFVPLKSDVGKSFPVVFDPIARKMTRHILGRSL